MIDFVVVALIVLIGLALLVHMSQQDPGTKDCDSLGCFLGSCLSFLLGSCLVTRGSGGVDVLLFTILLTVTGFMLLVAGIVYWRAEKREHKLF